MSDVENARAGANWHPGRFICGVVRNPQLVEQHAAHLPTPDGLDSIYNSPAEFRVKITNDSGLATSVVVRARFVNGPQPNLRAELLPVE